MLIRKIILVLTLLLATAATADEIHWAKDFKSGIEKAEKEKKPVLFVFSRHTCKYCVILEKTTFEDKRVVKALNNDFISIIAYSDEHDAMPQELWRPGTPTIWFLKSDGKPMFQPLMGAVKADAFLQALGIVKTEFDKSKIKTINGNKK
ncbi:thioredoxin family protein [Sulfurimonas sp.]